VIRFYAWCLRDESGAHEPKDEVYDAYKTFCEEELEEMPVSKKSFGKRLKKFPHVDSGQTGGGHSNERVYLNVRLREDLK
jgi:phage/plasmid-associated DNA primase